MCGKDGKHKLVADITQPFTATCLAHAGDPKNGDKLSDDLKKVLEEIGPEKIILGISDSAPTCKTAGRLLEEAFPHFSWLPCATHIMD